MEPLNVEEHASDLYAALHHDRSGRQWTYMPYGPFPNRAAFRKFLARAAADSSYVLFVIADADSRRAEGMASLGRIDPAIGSVEVGGIMFGPGLQRTAGATEAMFLLAEYVFDGLDYRRYEWKCDSLNKASIDAAIRLGFSFEGIWRNAGLYKGRNRDTAWLAMTREDWAEIRPVIQNWLQPANFTGSQQLTSLSQLIQARKSAPAPLHTTTEPGHPS